MSDNQRDYHFDMFAEALWQELVQANRTPHMRGYIDMNENDDPRDPTDYITIIAKCAYDLALHVLDQVSPSSLELGVNPQVIIERWISDIDAKDLPPLT